MEALRTVRAVATFGAALLAAAWCPFAVSDEARAAPGNLVRSFGEGGIVDLRKAPLSVFPGTFFVAADMATGPGGKSLVLGRGYSCSRTCPSGGLVTRYGLSGAPDPRYGDRGTAEIPAPSVGFGTELAVDRRGRAIVATRSFDQVVVARLDARGRPDASFGAGGAGGAAVLPVSAEWSDVTARVVQPGNRIVVVESWRPYFGNDPEKSKGTNLRVTRLLASGRLDRGFGRRGSRHVFVPRSLEPEDVAAQRNRGLLILAATCCGVHRVPLVVRLRGDGRVDRSFGRLGWLHRLKRPEGFRPEAILARPNGRVDVLGGVYGKLKPDGFVLRLRADGRRYRRFGHGGFRYSRWQFTDATLDGLGRILALAYSQAVRLKAGGRLDRTFGRGRGFVTLSEAVRFGRTTVSYSRGRPLIFSEGLIACRVVCAGRPTLTALQGGPGRRSHRR